MLLLLCVDLDDDLGSKTDFETPVVGRDAVEVGIPLLGGLGQFRRRHPRDGVVLPAENPDPRRREHREHRRLHPPSEQTQLDGPVVLGDDARHLDSPADPEPLELPGGGRLVGAVVGVASLPLDVPRQRGTGGREGGALERRPTGTARESGDRGGAGAREDPASGRLHGLV